MQNVGPWTNVLTMFDCRGLTSLFLCLVFLLVNVLAYSGIIRSNSWVEKHPNTSYRLLYPWLSLYFLANCTLLPIGIKRNLKKHPFKYGKTFDRRKRGKSLLQTSLLQYVQLVNVVQVSAWYMCGTKTPQSAQSQGISLNYAKTTYSTPCFPS